MTLTDYIRANAARLVHDWARTSSPTSTERGHCNASVSGNHLHELLLHVAESIDDSPERSAEAAVQNPKDLAAWGRVHAEERLRQGASLVDVVAEFCGLRELVLQSWNRFPHPDSESARWELLRFNQALDLGLTESVQHYSRAQTRTRDLFTGMLVHDLRNPLSCIANLANVLGQAPDSMGGTAQIAQRLRQASARMGGIIEEMLDVLQARLGQPLPVKPAATSFRDVCQSVIEELNHQYPDCKIKLTVEGNVDGVWDAARLSRVISNLGSNAVKYGFPDTVISISVTDRGDTVEVSVSNQGAAIASEDLISMFEPMVRLRQHSNEGAEASRGLGLGLYVAKQLVLAHGGAIDASSSDGWNVFTVTLPRVSKIS